MTGHKDPTPDQTSSGRDELVEYLRANLIGPSNGASEEIEGTPLLRYMMGILFPRGTSERALRDKVGAGVDEDGDSADRGDEEGKQEAGVGVADDVMPSSLSISFLVSPGSSIDCEVEAGRYIEADGEKSATSTRRGRARKKWRRQAIPSKSAPAAFRLTIGNPDVEVLDDLAKLRSKWRERNDGILVTVTLENTQRGGAFEVDHCLFQAQLRCTVVEGRILPYPVPRSFADVARHEEEYLYRESVPYARGHGCAATWSKVDGEVRRVDAAFTPSVDVPQPEFTLPAGIDGLDARSFELAFLASAADEPKLVTSALDSFVAAYGNWIERERRDAANESEEPASRLADVVERWATRMRKGVDLLRNNIDARRAFADANRAMGVQMLLSRHLYALSDAGRQLSPNEKVVPPAVSDLTGLCWRPFQLAFGLGLLESLWFDESEDRADVDVIWFPTGGGKTEAYLFVTAFELMRRRLVAGARDTATAIFSRYTLRMLTAQQFQRTAALFVALELVRMEVGSPYGARPFTLGLWVGNSLTPNRFKVAEERLDEFRERKGVGTNPFLIDRCPRCGTAIFHQAANPFTEWGVTSSAASFRLRCPRSACEFSSSLPVNLVDEALYQSPPSMVIGTVDKFANLPWREEAAVFFGGAEEACLMPSLLIQDELHLISGPLGTLDAMYEAAIEEIIRARGGVAPKIIGSTATIRNAADQVRGLYARPCYVFPSPIRRWDDAFFYRRNPARTRRYVGVMAQGYVRPVIALVWTAAALLQGARDASMSEAERDAFWTLIAYHNSRRELGRTMTAARDEIQTRVRVLARAEDAARVVERVMQLSANGTVSIDEAIRRLEASLGSKLGALDVVPCTNILSVGIDINRLGLMLVNGQPKLVAEYIQATSRVGRGKVDGLVVTLFSPMKPRDRSHYEDFRSFHENLYRYVEPTSVTPLSPPARKRTLHAAVIAAVRHSTEWNRNNGAASADLDDPRVQAITESLIERVRRMSDEPERDAGEVASEIELFLEGWRDQQQPNLVYDQSTLGPAFRGLIKPYGEARGRGVPTMRSMRHVDAEVDLRVVSEKVT